MIIKERREIGDPTIMVRKIDGKLTNENNHDTVSIFYRESSRRWIWRELGCSAWRWGIYSRWRQSQVRMANLVSWTSHCSWNRQLKNKQVNDKVAGKEDIIVKIYRLLNLPVLWFSTNGKQYPNNGKEKSEH